MLTLVAGAVFGSAQLRGHKYIRPKAIHDNDILEEFSKDYMYLSYVRYINSVSLGQGASDREVDADASPRRSRRLRCAGTRPCSMTFRVCVCGAQDLRTARRLTHTLSVSLSRTRQVKTWDKVNSGMLKMYAAEVLAKLPVAQHFLFGSLLPYPIPLDAEDADEAQRNKEDGVSTDEHGHLHVRGEGFGDCCGIKIPSAFAAAEEVRKKEAAGNVRRIPFD